MAVVTYTVLDPGEGHQFPSGTRVIKWANLNSATPDSGMPYICPHYADKSIQLVVISGTTGSITFQGSNSVEAAPTKWGTLTEPDGTDLSTLVTDGIIRQVLENTYQVRPLSVSGDKVFDVYLLLTTVARR